MGVPQQFSSSLNCQLRIIQAKNIYANSKGSLFIRYYLSPSKANKRITLKTHEISSNSNLHYWDETFSLQCLGNEISMQNLNQSSIVFELRLRKEVPILGRIGWSQLLGRGEVSWRSVLESPNMEVIDKWVMMVCSSRAHDQVKAPSLHIEMKVTKIDQAIVDAKSERRKRYDVLKKQDHDHCGCMCQYGGCSCADYEIFALAATFEAF